MWNFYYSVGNIDKKGSFLHDCKRLGRSFIDGYAVKASSARIGCFGSFKQGLLAS